MLSLRVMLPTFCHIINIYRIVVPGIGQSFPTSGTKLYRITFTFNQMHEVKAFFLFGTKVLVSTTSDTGIKMPQTIRRFSINSVFVLLFNFFIYPLGLHYLEGILCKVVHLLSSGLRATNLLVVAIRTPPFVPYGAAESTL